MNVLIKMRAASSLIMASVLNRRMPLVVGWSLTTRCTHQCRYCNVWRLGLPDFPSDRAHVLIDEMADAGIALIHFTGGEPLLYEDLGGLLSHCQERGIQTSLATSGWNLAKRISKLEALEIITISLDGPEEVNNRVRGDNSYRIALEAINLARSRGVKVRISTVITSENLQEIQHVLWVAEKYGCRVVFQPSTSNLLDGEGKNPLVPQIGRYRKAIEALIKEKQKGNPFIGNSLPALEYFLSYPGPSEIRCLSALVSCRIDSRGEMKSCQRISGLGNKSDCISVDFYEAFHSVAFPISCQGCWCSSRLEINLLMSLNPRAVFDAIRNT